MAVDTDLTGRRAVVTGGCTGLGRAIADRLAKAGAAITVLDLPEALTLADLPAGYARFAVDLGAPGCQAAMRGVADLDPAEWARVMAVNVWGVAATLGAFSSAMARSGRGSAVVMASINGYRAHPQQMLYTASKHAVVGVMRSAALELGPAGIRVNALAPGPVATDALLGRLADRHERGGPTPDGALADLAGATALRRIVTPDQVAQTALWLASDAAAGITGIVVPVEAGLA